jgi:hypothetical protein
LGDKGNAKQKNCGDYSASKVIQGILALLTQESAGMVIEAGQVGVAPPVTEIDVSANKRVRLTACAEPPIRKVAAELFIATPK